MLEKKDLGMVANITNTRGVSMVVYVYPSVHGALFSIENLTVRCGAVSRKRKSHGAVRCGFQIL